MLNRGSAVDPKNLVAENWLRTLIVNHDRM